MGTNRLSDRLKLLSAQGIVARRTLPSPADVTVYELTPLGEGLRPVVLGLARWGSELTPGADLDPASARGELLALTLAAGSPPHASVGLHESYEFHVGEEHFHIAIDDGRASARSGTSPREPAIAIDCDIRTFAELAWGELSPSAAVRSRRVHVVGKPAELTRAFLVLGVS